MIVTENASDVPVDATIEAGRSALIRGNGFELRVAGRCDTGCNVAVDDHDDETVLLDGQGVVEVAGLGFQTNTEVRLSLGSDDTVLSSVTVDRQGEFVATVPLGGIEPGEFTLWATGTSVDGKTRTIGIAVMVVGSPASQPAAVQLPRTGTSTVNLILMALLALSGAAMTGTVRRRFRTQDH